jgi:F0F1-type ATP synthase membrane subunit b/b'
VARFYGINYGTNVNEIDYPNFSNLTNNDNEILGKIGFDWQVALANLVNFLIIVFLLKKFAFKPIAKIIQDRQNKINEGLENAKKAAEEAMKNAKSDIDLAAAQSEFAAMAAQLAAIAKLRKK